MVFGRMDSAFGIVAAEADCEFHQFGRSGRRAPGRAASAAVSRACSVSGSALEAASAICLAFSSGSVYGLRQCPVHGAALSRTRVGVDAMGQQRVGESHEIAVNPDDALGFGLFEQLDAVRWRR